MERIEAARSNFLWKWKSHQSLKLSQIKEWRLRTSSKIMRKEICFELSLKKSKNLKKTLHLQWGRNKRSVFSICLTRRSSWTILWAFLMLRTSIHHSLLGSRLIMKIRLEIRSQNAKASLTITLIRTATWVWTLAKFTQSMESQMMIRILMNIQVCWSRRKTIYARGTIGKVLLISRVRFWWLKTRTSSSKGTLLSTSSDSGQKRMSLI